MPDDPREPAGAGASERKPPKRERPAVKIGIWLALGVGVGAVVGVATGGLARGIVFGAAAGVIVGLFLSR